jgi:Fe-S-cluster-containing dehydrogenase component
MAATSYFYLHTDQWRYEAFGPAELASPLGQGLFAGKSFADCVAKAARLGWSPSHPAFSRNPLDLFDESERGRLAPSEHIISELRAGRLKFAADDPDNPANWPRVLTVWRANLLGSSGKGMEYFMRHLVGADDAVRAGESAQGLRPAEVTWREEAPRGKLDLLTAIDFRMTSTCTYADIVLPAATWYEKHDLSSTDMHPFVHSFNPAIAPPWETRTDFDAFGAIARDFSRLAETHLGKRTDIVAVPLMHDTPDELAQPGGVVRDWADGDVEPVPGVTMPKLVTVERDYPMVAAKMAALGPLTETLGTTVKGITWKPDKAVEYLRHANGTVRGGIGDGQPSLARDVHLAEAILALSGTTNGQVAVAAWRELEKRTGTGLADLAAERAGDRISFADTQVQPRAVITSPEWSGSETGGRRYSPFTVNVERKKPWHTLTGRMQFFADHDWMHEFGEALPMRVMAQVAMVMNLDKCIGCHTCSVTCKQVWTNRPGTEYVYFNNVETKPGVGYPKRYEEQEQWHGGWTLDRKGRLQLKAGGRVKKLATLFWNPDLPSIDDYGDPWTYDYQTLIDAPAGTANPSAHAISALTGKDMRLRWGANWEDDLVGAPERAGADPNLVAMQARYAREAIGRPPGRQLQDAVKLAYEQAFMFYLPRICEHCLNPSCVASCPSGAMYKRAEDGIVLVDQDKCRGWRMCVSGCPYKKVYFNHRSG